MDEPIRPSSPGFSVKKRVDEAWKNTVEKEKGVSGPSPEEARRASPPPDPAFPLFISGLGMQALASLGEIPTNQGGQPRVDLEEARYLIDVIDMLVKKTKGNLAPEEDQMIQNLLYDLRVKFVEKSKSA